MGLWDSGPCMYMCAGFFEIDFTRHLHNQGGGGGKSGGDDASRGRALPPPRGDPRYSLLTAFPVHTFSSRCPEFEEVEERGRM